MLHTINIVIVCIVMSQSYRHGCMHGYGYRHGYSYSHIWVWPQLQSKTSNNGTGTFILYRLLDTHPPIYHENYPIIILLPDTTMASMHGLTYSD